VEGRWEHKKGGGPKKGHPGIPNTDLVGVLKTQGKRAGSLPQVII